MEPLNNIDVIILVIVAISMVVAFVRGFIKEVLSILGLTLFVVLTAYLSPILVPLMNKYIASKMMAQFVVFLLIMAVFYAIWIICSDKLISRVRSSTLSFMDRLFGLLFGFIRAVILLGFCFLAVKIVLPEELKEGHLKESKYFMMSELSSDMIEKLLPNDFIKNTVKSVEDINKVDKKSKDKTIKKEENKKQDLPSELDREQMDKMFELLVKPEIKDKSSSVSADKKKNKNDAKGYNQKETSGLDRLINLTYE